MTLIRETTPKYESNHESIIKASKSAFGSPSGGGILSTKRSRSSSIPWPVLALTKGALVASMPIMSSISCLTLSGSDCGKSILFITANTSRF